MQQFMGKVPFTGGLQSILPLRVPVCGGVVEVYASQLSMEIRNVMIGVIALSKRRRI